MDPTAETKERAAKEQLGTDDRKRDDEGRLPPVYQLQKEAEGIERNPGRLLPDVG